MKIVLVKPPERSYLNFGTFSLGVIAAAIRHLVDVSIIDATDLPEKEAVKAVYNHAPDLIGITVMGLNSIIPAARFIRHLKKNTKLSNSTKETLIIAGGHGASMLPLVLLNAGASAVVMGEGELTFQKIVEQGILPGSPGLACIVEKKLILGTSQELIIPLDKLLPPARELMPPPKNGVHLMETSRGCPHNCGFCETTRFYRKLWRPHSPTHVAAEVKRLVDDYDAWIIQFADDNFAASPQRVRQICEELVNITLPAFIMVSARADDLIADPDLLPAMGSARILRITVGVETLDLNTATTAGKPIGLTTYKEVFKRMKQVGIFSIASFIIGLPGENSSARKQAVELAVEVEPDSAHFLPFIPFPGIPLTKSIGCFNPNPTDIRDAQRFNLTFFQHPKIKSNLESAAKNNNIRGFLARATLNHHLH